MPLPTPLYEPDAAQGTVLYAACTLNSQVPAGLRVTVAGVAAQVSLSRHAGRDVVEARFDVPPGRTLQLQHGTVAFDTDRPRSSGRVEFGVVSLVDTPIVNNANPAPGMEKYHLPVTAPLPGGMAMPGGRVDRHFWLASYLDLADADEVWLSLPPFTVDGSPATLPRLHFRRRYVVVGAVLNC